jgi:fibrillarin-like rRNA methylase
MRFTDTWASTSDEITCGSMFCVRRRRRRRPDICGHRALEGEAGVHESQGRVGSWRVYRWVRTSGNRSTLNSAICKYIYIHITRDTHVLYTGWARDTGQAV